MSNAFLYAALAQAPLILGGLIVYWFKVPTKIVGWLGGLGAGSLVSAIAYNLIAQAKGAGPAVVVAGMLVGAAVFVLLDKLVENRFGEEAGAIGIVLGSIIDGVPESVIFGVQLATGVRDQLGLSDGRHDFEYPAVDRPFLRHASTGPDVGKRGAHVAWRGRHLWPDRRRHMARGDFVSDHGRLRFGVCGRGLAGHADRFADTFQLRARRTLHRCLDGGGVCAVHSSSNKRCDNVPLRTS